MDDVTIDIRGILALLRRQFRLILICFVVIIGAAGLYAFSQKPVYTSTALVLVDTTRKNLLDPDAQIASSGSDNARIDSEVEIMRSDNILLRVIDRLDLTRDSEVGVSLSVWERVLAMLRIAEPATPSADDLLNSVIGGLRSSITVQRRGLTYLIAVSARADNPAQAATLANAVASAYIEDQLASKVASTLAAREVLQARITQAREAIAASEGSFDSFIDSNLDRIAQEADGNDIAATQRQIQQLVQARNTQTNLANQVQASLASNDLTAVVASIQSSALDELQRQKEELASRLSSETANSPVAVDLQAELEAIDERLLATANEELATLRQSIAASQDQELDMRQDLRRSVLSSNLPPDILTDLFALQQGAELARNQYQLLLSRAQDLEAQADLQLADSRIVSPALAPAAPSSPNRRLILTLAGLVGLGMGIGLAFLYENFIGGFTSEAQLSSVLRTKVATSIPRQKPKNDGESLANLVVASPLSVFAESIRRLRATIVQSMRKGRFVDEIKSTVIMVTSTAPNEGKTTVSLALARSYALSGNRTLLIDADLRKPSLHRQLGIEPSQGLHDFLAGSRTGDITDIVSKDTMSDVTVIVGARNSEYPTDQLLTSRSFASLIAASRRTFDTIIIDTPPIGPVVDGLYIAPFADVIVFVTRWSTTAQIDAKRALAAVTDSKTPEAEVLAVVNQQDQTRSSYQRRYGDYYYSHQD